MQKAPIGRFSAGCWWAAAGGVLGALVLVAAVVVGRFRGAAWSAEHPAVPVLTVLPMPTVTVLPPATVAPVGQPAAPTATPDLPQVPLSQGALVQVFGTGGDGLRLRESPGLGGRIKLLGLESEVFLLREGPVEADGFTWWLLENPYASDAFGWAVADFLRVLGP